MAKVNARKFNFNDRGGGWNGPRDDRGGAWDEPRDRKRSRDANNFDGRRNGGNLQTQTPWSSAQGYGAENDRMNQNKFMASTNYEGNIYQNAPLAGPGSRNVSMQQGRSVADSQAFRQNDTADGYNKWASLAQKFKATGSNAADDGNRTNSFTRKAPTDYSSYANSQTYGNEGHEANHWPSSAAMNMRQIQSNAFDPKPNYAEVESNNIPKDIPTLEEVNHKGIKVVVLPKMYPEISLDTPALKALEEALVEEIALGWHDKLQFEGSCLRPGRLMFFCSNEATVQWMLETVSKFRSGSGVELRAILGDYAPDPLKIKFFVPGSIDQPIEKTLALLAAQNKGINIIAWKLLDKELESYRNFFRGGQLLTFEVDEQSMETISRHCNTLYYRFGKIEVTDAGNNT